MFVRILRFILDINEKGEIYIKDVGGVLVVGEVDLKWKVKMELVLRISVGVKKSGVVFKYFKVVCRFYNEIYWVECERLSKVLVVVGGECCCGVYVWLVLCRDGLYWRLVFGLLYVLLYIFWGISFFLWFWCELFFR